MIGINIDNLEKIINTNELTSDSVTADIKELSKSINQLSDCYSGESIQFLFNDLQEQQVNLQKISDVVKNYSAVLSDVLVAYQTQDEAFQYSTSHINTENNL